MAYKSYPWHCYACNRDFLGHLGKASHYRSKAHRANIERLQEQKKRGTQ